MLTQSQATELVIEIQDYSQNLSAWERGFVRDMDRKLDRDEDLTAKQVSMLLRIHANAVPASGVCKAPMLKRTGSDRDSGQSGGS